MRTWWSRLRRALPKAERAIPPSDWQACLVRYPFLQTLASAEQERLRTLCGLFLTRKQFTGAGGLQVDDAMALDIAAQACLPLLHMGAPTQSIRWYDDFVGIVVHPDTVWARREMHDEAGVVHYYHEELAGEAMQDGPVMLTWRNVAAAQQGNSAQDDGEAPFNVVIHEFVHKMDMRNGEADGCPPLPAGFLGARNAQAARQVWLAVLQPAYAAFREQAIVAERFSGPPTWLDSYAAEALPEFFAVACEAYFVAPARFAQEFPRLAPLFDAFFRPAAATP